LKRQFRDYHVANNLEFHLTRHKAIEYIRDNVIRFCVLGVVPVGQRDRIATLWHQQMAKYISERREAYYSASQYERDARCVAAPGTSDKYRAWTVMDDHTVMENIPEAREYAHARIPNSDRDGPALYKWWGPEVISPVLDYDDPETLESLRKVCGTLRDRLRVHKPMAQVSFDVHVHIGQEHGWTLLQMKKFATLWHLIENDLYTLHRRGQRDAPWVGPLATESRLAYEVIKNEHIERSVVATTPEPMRSAYAIQMAHHMPRVARPDQRAFFHNIWQYARLTDLSEALALKERKGSLCWYLTGRKLTPEPTTEYRQTMEFRMMQGTMDAQHIWRWASICERLVVFCRDSSAAVFKSAIQDIMDGKLPELGFSREDLAWFAARQTDDGYFEYPDRNHVEWSQVFMVPGFGATHG